MATVIQRRVISRIRCGSDFGWRDFGHAQRIGQVASPIYLLVFTELGGEKRFSATIVWRFANMSLLTKSDRRVEKVGNLDKYNLELKEGRAALNVVYN